ncbi:S-DNA-T family DNA segregation ATPase FtsK/SpoIIIE [Saccharothrix coeruleofusca]|uniref:FtsK/SpoIIIE domain-containing protein n=1 Tax=Saccharothrix coeruleofusca TaxID=33919 RepID=UPI001AE7BDD7|nr:FtsK/SpoIIIE domain-containing protein [Saccharothrix coeruleofusca]MBP2340202.1 S-DNA-T family DNA segregation ATPase FtsK/SpoIIIE [Saccharothrix coeruleofusca]
MSTTTVTGGLPDERPDGSDAGGKVYRLPTADAPPTAPVGAAVEPASPVLDAELVEDDAAAADRPVVPVDQPGSSSDADWVTRLRETQRLPIIPGYLRTLSEARQTAGWIGRHYAHATGYHAVRAPLYLLRLAARSPQGAVLLLAATGRWVSDAEGRPLRRAMANAGEAERYLKLVAERNARVRLRTLLLLVGSTLGVVLFMVLPGVTPGWVTWVCGMVALGILGKLGTPADKPVAGRAVVGPQAAKLTSDMVVRALTSLGIAGINGPMSKNPHAIGFTSPIHRDGPGWRADIELPGGVTAADVIEKRERLASGLGRALGCVWPEQATDGHPGQLVLWVGDRDMSKAKQPAWPLRSGKPIDLFKSQPFGTDVRGRWVEIVLMFVAGIVGAIPRMGKTFTLRELLLIAALDPRAQLHTYDLKGTGDLSPLGVVSHRYRAGDDAEDIEYALTDLRALREEMRRRTKVIRELPKDLCPENKVTSELASKRSLRLHPIVIGVDECQVWFEHPEHGKEIEEICTDLVKRGPATGIVLILATQRPDSKSIPTPISDNAVLRFCLKVTGQMANDMVLGTSSYRNGERATQFSFSDKGIGLLKGVTDETTTVKGVYIDGPGAEAIAAKARALRTAAGLLSGYAAGLDVEVTETTTDTLLPDVLTAMGSADKAWSESIVDRLAELRPAVYGTWADQDGKDKAKHLTAALKPYGIATVQVWGTDPATGKGANRRGVDRDHITAAITERDGK